MLPTQRNLDLDPSTYSFKKCMSWGVARAHFEKVSVAWENKAYIAVFRHLVLGILEGIPVLGQFLSLSEKYFYHIPAKSRIDNVISQVFRKSVAKRDSATFIISSQNSVERDKARSKPRGLTEEAMAKAIADEEDRSGKVAAERIPDEIMKIARDSNEVTDTIVVTKSQELQNSDIMSLFNYLRKFSPDEIHDDGKICKKETFLDKAKEVLQRYSEGVDGAIINQNDIPYIQQRLLQALKYIQGLEERNEPMGCAIGNLTRALLHCGDRAIQELDDLYFFQITTSPDYVKTLSLDHAIASFFLIERVRLFKEICYSTIWPSIEDSVYGLHYATTERYYQRILSDELNLGEKLQKGMYEDRTKDLCFHGCEKLIKEGFLAVYTPEYMVKILLKNLNSGQKGCLSMRCFDYLKDHYDGEIHTVLDEDGNWKQEACLLLLKKCRILDGDTNGEEDFFNLVKKT